MKTFTQTWLLCTLATLTTARKCIRANETEAIAQRWLNIFASGGSGGLADAVTNEVYKLPSQDLLSSSSADLAEQITIYDEGATNGSTAAYVQNATQLGTTINASSYGGGGVTNVTYDVVFTFHTCDRIALRWQQNVITTASIGYGSTVPAGKAIEFKGTDLLTIDLPSKKVMNVTTSGDLLNYYRALGYPLGVENVTTAS